MGAVGAVGAFVGFWVGLVLGAALMVGAGPVLTVLGYGVTPSSSNTLPSAGRPVATSISVILTPLMGAPVAASPKIMRAKSPN